MAAIAHLSTDCICTEVCMMWSTGSSCSSTGSLEQYKKITWLHVCMHAWRSSSPQAVGVHLQFVCEWCLLIRFHHFFIFCGLVRGLGPRVRIGDPSMDHRLFSGWIDLSYTLSGRHWGSQHHWRSLAVCSGNLFIFCRRFVDCSRTIPSTY